jgi:enoyl-CoA hydratase/carnithine racemase
MNTSSAPIQADLANPINEPGLLIEQKGCVAIWTIYNPTARNALSPKIYEQGMQAVRAAIEDPNTRAVIIQGAGSTFCGGGNLNRLLANRQLDRAVQAASIENLHQWVRAIIACPKPVIAAVEGAAAGAGFSLVLACDMIVAADNARFVMSYSKVGLSPDGGGSWSLARRLPAQLAFELCALAQPIAAQRLADLGIISRISASGAALSTALGLADQFALQPPRALARIKNLVRNAQGRTMNSQFDLERDLFVESLFDAEAGEGIQAFLDKRPAKFP